MQAALEEQAFSMAWLAPGTVLAVSGAALVVDVKGARRTATLAQIADYDPRPGDRVLVGGDDHDAWAIAVLSALRISPCPSLRADDGASASVEEGVLRVRDPAARVVFEHRDGVGVVCAPERLRFEAAHIELRARDTVTVEGRDVALRASDELAMSAVDASMRVERLEASGDEVTAAFADATLVGKRLRTAFERALHTAVVVELEAERVTERAKELVTEVEELVQVTAGRIRQLATNALELRGRRALLRAEADVSIKGERIELA